MQKTKPFYQFNGSEIIVTSGFVLKINYCPNKAIDYNRKATGCQYGPDQARAIKPAKCEGVIIGDCHDRMIFTNML
jgi:hypothetical protein